MLIVMNLAPFVEMMLLNRIFATSISAVDVATSPGWSILSPPTVNLVLFFSLLSGSYTAHELPVCYIFSAIVCYLFPCDERDCVSRGFYSFADPIC